LEPQSAYPRKIKKQISGGLKRQGSFREKKRGHKVINEARSREYLQPNLPKKL